LVSHQASAWRAHFPVAFLFWVVVILVVILVVVFVVFVVIVRVAVAVEVVATPPALRRQRRSGSG
jgi:hypothetical protein